MAEPSCPLHHRLPPACVQAWTAAMWSELVGADVGPLSGGRAPLHRKRGLIIHSAVCGEASACKQCVSKYAAPAHTEGK